MSTCYVSELECCCFCCCFYSQVDQLNACISRRVVKTGQRKLLRRAWQTKVWLHTPPQCVELVLRCVRIPKLTAKNTVRRLFLSELWVLLLLQPAQPNQGEFSNQARGSCSGARWQTKERLYHRPGGWKCLAVRANPHLDVCANIEAFAFSYCRLLCTELFVVLLFLQAIIKTDYFYGSWRAYTRR